MSITKVYKFQNSQVSEFALETNVPKTTVIHYQLSSPDKIAMSKLRHNRKLQQVTPAGKVLARHKSQSKLEDIEAQQKNEKMNIEPYIVAKFLDKKFVSNVSKGLNPTWETSELRSQFDVPVPLSHNRHPIKIFVYDEDLAVGDADDLIGTGVLFDDDDWPAFDKSIPIQDLPVCRLEGVNGATLAPEYRGEITFQLKYTVGDPTFGIVVVKGEHLKNVDNADSADISQNAWVLIQCISALLLYLTIGTVGYAHAENWTYIDGFYFSVVTLTTVGYGDLAPTTPLMKALTCAYGMLGIAYIGAAMGILGSAFMEGVTKKMSSVSKVPDPEAPLADEKVKKSFFSAQAKSRMKTIFLWTSIMNLNIFGGAAFFHFYEGQDFGDMVYLGFITLSTIGYGDVKPFSQGGRLFCSFWIMVGSVIVANMLGIFAGFWIEDRQEKLRNEILQRKLDSNTLRNWDVDGDGTIDRYEYLKARLLQLDVCTQFEIQNIMESFMIHDKDGSGTVNIKDIMSGMGSDNTDVF